MSNYNYTKSGITLSDREKEILSDLCQGLTREEIAQNGNISINTVKSFFKNIEERMLWRMKYLFTAVVSLFPGPVSQS